MHEVELQARKRGENPGCSRNHWKKNVKAAPIGITDKKDRANEGMLTASAMGIWG